MEYLEFKRSELVEKPLWHHTAGLSYTASGYGSKIPTAHCIRHNKRLKRIYCVCYSNSGTLYILQNNKPVYLKEI